jgi:hypothetical protein
VGNIYKRIRILGAEIDREFPVAETMTRASVSPDASAELPYRTGAPGRPSPKYLAEQEMRRRANQGILCSELAAEIRELSNWLKNEHPHAPPVKPKALESSLREEYWKLRWSINLP